MSKAKATVCWHCKETLSGNLGRSSVCSGCKRDARVCRNCRFYDSHSYNECHEIQAERVVDKENANFCDYFSTIGRNSGTTMRKKGSNQNMGKSEALKAAHALFKS